MNKEKKFVPPEGFMKMDFDPHMWDLIDRGVLPVKETSVLVRLNTGNEAKVNIYIEGARLAKVEDGGFLSSLHGSRAQDGENYFERAFGRIMFQMLLFTTFGSKNWILYGYVMAGGGSEKVPILILYSESIQHAFYSMKRETDTEGPPSNEQKGGSKFSPWMN